MILLALAIALVALCLALLAGALAYGVHRRLLTVESLPAPKFTVAPDPYRTFGDTQ